MKYSQNSQITPNYIEEDQLAEELAREWELEQVYFSPFNGTFLGELEAKGDFDDE
jgi:hypothetical protein